MKRDTQAIPPHMGTRDQHMWHKFSDIHTFSISIQRSRLRAVWPSSHGSGVEKRVLRAETCPVQES